MPNSGGDGHVAIVEKIDGGKIYISESTWNGVTFRYREIYDTNYLYGYIYLDKANH
ncbi:surface antigen [Clostridium beijerinckii]|nr:surface antigen [Clostridium beijerinckii]